MLRWEHWRVNDKILAGRSPLPYPSPVKSGSSESDLSKQEIRQSTGSTHDTISSDVHGVFLSSNSSFGRNMGDSPMEVVWPSRGADGEYNSVALSHCKVPYEVMPTPDLQPLFALAHRYLCAAGRDVEHHLGIQPHAGIGGLECSHSTHQKIGHGRLNLTHIPTIPTEPPVLLPQYIPGIPIPIPKTKGGGGSSVSFVHGALCTVGLLLVFPSGVLMAEYAKATGSPRVFLLHRPLQFGVAGASITGGTLAYLFMHNHGSSMAHKVGGASLVLLCVVQCTIGAGSTASQRRAALRCMWLGIISAGQSALLFVSLLCPAPGKAGLIKGLMAASESFRPSLPCTPIGIMPVQRRFGSVKEDAKGEFVALDMRLPSNDELKDGDEYRMP
ncbi:hypothetical protein EDB89DRAFT_2074102 [Lactarius sanguifluus]|nr:hypothetical protein EDB89DRAFT_2074102 [Lactarius sanguifluus]